jgi:hypothetical protein
MSMPPNLNCTAVSVVCLIFARDRYILTFLPHVEGKIRRGLSVLQSEKEPEVYKHTHIHDVEGSV